MNFIKLFAGMMIFIGLLASSAFVPSMLQGFQKGIVMNFCHINEMHDHSHENNEDTIFSSHLRYSSLLGGSSHDHVHIMTMDSKGNPVVAGYTYSKDFPATYRLGATATTWCNVFVIKFNRQNHEIIFSTLVGGNYIDRPTAIFIDESDHIYLTGYTQSHNFPVSRNALQSTLKGRKDGFLMKLEATGSAFIYSTYIGGSMEDVPSALAVDPGGNAYITGATNSSDFPVTRGAFQRLLNAEKDIFFAKINPNGTHLLHSTYIGGSNKDLAQAMVYCKENKLIFIAGNTFSANFPHLRRLGGAQDFGSSAIFVIKILPNAYEIVPCFFAGGSGKDDVVSLALDSQNNLWVGGNAFSEDFPAQLRIESPSSHYPGIFLLQWSIEKRVIEKSLLISGNDKDFLRTMAFKKDGSLLLGGLTYSSNLISKEGMIQNVNKGRGDGFIIRMDNVVEDFMFATYLGGSSFDEIRSLKVGINYDILIVGNTLSKDFPLTQNAKKKTGSAQCGFFTRLSVVPVFKAPTLAQPEKDSMKTEIDPVFLWNFENIGGSYQLSLYDYNHQKIYQSDSLHRSHFKLPFLLEHEKRYYWRVQLSHPSGITKSSPMWMFKTVSRQIQLSLAGYSLKSSYSSSEQIFIRVCLLNIGNVPIENIAFNVQHPEFFEINHILPFYSFKPENEQTNVSLPGIPYRKVLSFQIQGTYNAPVDKPTTFSVDMVASYARHQIHDSVKISLHP